MTVRKQGLGLGVQVDQAVQADQGDQADQVALAAFLPAPDPVPSWEGQNPSWEGHHKVPLGPWGLPPVAYRCLAWGRRR